MSGRIRAHIRSNVVGYVALFLVLTGGSAYALDGRNTVTSDDIVNREVKTPDLDIRSVTGNRLAANSVKTGRVVDNSLLGADIADGSLTGTDVGPDSLTGANLDESSLGKVPSAAQADSAATASNASSLGGFAASAYKKGCEQGTVQGFAEVPGTANFSNSYVSIPNSYNCAGGPAFARRAGEGIYYVRFPGNSSTLGVGSVNYNSGSGAEDDFVTLRSLTLNGDHFYIVLVHDADDGDEDDDTFTLMTF